MTTDGRMNGLADGRTDELMDGRASEDNYHMTRMAKNAGCNTIATCLFNIGLISLSATERNQHRHKHTQHRNIHR